MESKVRVFEAMETSRQLRTDVERACRAGRRPNGLTGDEFRPIMVRNTTEDVTAQEQQLRQREQVPDIRSFGTTKLQAVDRCRKIGEGKSAACVTSGCDHEAFFNPVSSAG